MNKLVFLLDPSVIYEGNLSKVNENVLRIEFTSKVPAKKTLVSGMNIINEHNGKVMSSKEDFTTIYRTYEDNKNIVELSNDGSVWVKPLKKVDFRVDNGATLEGECSQEVYNYEELVIPKVITEEGYEFVKWSPEIPSTGEIEKDMVFNAIVEDKNVYFHCSGGGVLDGETRQFVEDYSELTPPTPVADKDYKFVGWMPEIPESGVVEVRDFYAVFENTISDRLSFVESDLTDTQLGLVENFDLAMTTAEEVTDCQMALVELYNMFLTQIAE